LQPCRASVFVTVKQSRSAIRLPLQEEYGSDRPLIV
jgi:hypothetical protein